MGGLVAWIVVHENDNNKAKSLLIVGLVMTIVEALVGVALMILMGYFIQT
jgi:ABC-type transport system involved in cytochrome bd biosynthesis fused ATPase/permease subunit